MDEARKEKLFFKLLILLGATILSSVVSKITGFDRNFLILMTLTFLCYALQEY